MTKIVRLSTKISTKSPIQCRKGDRLYWSVNNDNAVIIREWVEVKNKPRLMPKFIFKYLVGLITETKSEVMQEAEVTNG